MSKQDLVNHMVAELNFYVKHYDACNDTEVKEEWENDYKQRAKAFNGLLTSIYGLTNRPYFSRKIEKYKEDREWRFSTVE